MKRIMATMLCILALTAALTACGNKKTGEQVEGSSYTTPSTLPQTQPYDAEPEAEPEPLENDFGYEVPEKALVIDMTAEDPSTDDVKFVYDSQGRIMQYVYKTGENDTYVNYTYFEDGTVNIFATINGKAVEAKVIKLPGEYDPQVGFSVIEGYYFKGYSAG